jgi:2-polyprenyl-6-methoxyphenol hydroxylase-like FAD-dependent oxidoreductase
VSGGPERALVVGGGIGGLALAGALARRGVAVDVVETQPEWSISRSGIALQAPALRALAALGLLDAVAAAGFGMTEFRYHDGAGTQRATSELPRLAGPGAPGTVGVLRPALHAILLDAAERAGARVRLGTTVQALEGDGAAALSDGTSARYDAIVGADGIRSRVRDLALGDRAPDYTGVVVWRALLDRPPEVDAFHLYNAPRATCGLCPVSDAQLYLFAVEPQPEFARVEAEREPELMRGLLRDFGGLAGVLRDRIVDPGQIVRRPVEAILVPPPWHAGRVVLIGDAVHAPPPTLAAGAAIALEDAAVLDELLAEASGDGVEAALAAFTERRWERCRLVVQQSVARTEGIIRPTPDFDVAAFERRIWSELAKPF